MTPKKHLYPAVIIGITLFFSFYHLSVQNIMEWDESRNAVNAWEMFRNGNFIDLYYGGEPDTWNAKPPLFIWLVTLGYKIFGVGAFALRLPSVLSTLVFFLMLYKLVRMKAGETTALLSCLVLLGCNSVVARHMGITGDFDALLLCFLTIATYHFLRFADEGRRASIYYMTLFTGLAFYTKGTAALLYLPAYFLYLLYKGKVMSTLKNRHTWLAILLFSGIAASWVILVSVYGQKSTGSFYGSSNSIETMLVHDTFRRLTSDNFGQKPNYLFVLSTLDSRMNMWHYLFFATTVGSLIYLFRKRRSEAGYGKYELVIFSWCVILPLSLILTLATNKHPWYFAPAFPYVAIVTAAGIVYACKRWKVLTYPVALFTLFTLCWHFRDLYRIPTNMHSLLGKESKYFKATEEIIITRRPTQDIFMYMTWSEKQQMYISKAEDVSTHSGQVAILSKDELSEEVLRNITEVQYFDNYCIALIK